MQCERIGLQLLIGAISGGLKSLSGLQLEAMFEAEATAQASLQDSALPSFFGSFNYASCDWRGLVSF